MIDRNPYNAPPYIARGQSLNAIGKYDSALEDFTAALNVDNRNADAFFAWVEANGYHVAERIRNYAVNENFMIVPQERK